MNKLNTYVFRSRFDGSVRTVFDTTLERAEARLPYPRLHQWTIDTDKERKGH